MARNIGADGRTVYRAVITKTYDNGRQWTSHEGPYTEPGPARARVSFWRNRMRRNGGTAEGHIEQAHTIWAPLDGKEQRPAERAAAAIRAQAYRDAAAQLRADADTAEAAVMAHYGNDIGKGAADMLRVAATDLDRRAAEIHPAPEEQQQ
ncbi:hypothetical protein [Streptomyces sp. NPDC102370]|uniref:hypothetical protein n=1 Tax=Streptomyces sp. NPDC102370 TaxID=3366163 RepID=UPI0038284EEE